MNMRAIGLATLCLVAMPVPAFAQTDEIQIYDGETVPRGNIQSDDPHYGSTVHGFKIRETQRSRSQVFLCSQF
jgi:hypothetical protein